MGIIINNNDYNNNLKKWVDDFMFGKLTIECMYIASEEGFKSYPTLILFNTVLLPCQNSPTH